jgi:signal transduction histidine kinase
MSLDNKYKVVVVVVVVVIIIIIIINSKLINLQEEINAVIEELLEEDEMDITDLNNLIYAAATIMTQTLNEPSKRSKNRRNIQFWKI